MGLPVDGPGRRRRRVRALVPDVPAQQGGALRPARTLPPPASAVTARRDDRGGLDRWAADDGGGVRHDAEPRRPAVWEGACRPHATACMTPS